MNSLPLLFALQAADAPLPDPSFLDKLAEHIHTFSGLMWGFLAGAIVSCTGLVIRFALVSRRPIRRF